MGGHHHHHHHTLPADNGDSRYREMRKVTLIGSAIDLTLGVLKLIFGYLAHSSALVADGVHSLSDLATDIMVLVAAKHGSRDADETHPYGHGRFETVATVALGIALMIVAVGIAWDAINRLFHPDELLQPGIWALIIAGLSVLLKEWTYHYTMRLARKLRSDMLKANAWHSRSDAISSIIVVVGVLGTMAGLNYLDSIAAVGVALMVAKIGWDLAWQSLHELVDTALDPERVAAISKAIMDVDGVRELHMLRTRRMGGEALVDVHILVEPKLSVSEGHYISESVRQHLIRKIDEVQDVLVHIDPEDDSEMALTMNLPPRRAILAQLDQQWQDQPLSKQIKRVVLHYLDGKVNIELFVPVTYADDSQIADLIRSGKALPDVSEIDICFI
jgi:cation diffusion facilitator family transporter